MASSSRRTTPPHWVRTWLGSSGHPISRSPWGGRRAPRPSASIRPTGTWIASRTSTRRPPRATVRPATHDVAVKRLRVAMIGARGVPATFGGVEHHVEELGSRLAQRGHEVVVYSRRGY